MTWLLLAMASGGCFAISSLLERYVLNTPNSDPLAFTFFFSAISTLLLIPVVLYQPHFSTSAVSWALIGIISALIIGNNVLHSHAMKHASATIVGTINKLKIVWVFLLGLILAYEIWSPYKGLGIILTIFAGVILVGSSNTKATSKGIRYAFLSTLFIAVAIVMYKPVLQEFNILSFTFCIFAIPAVLIFIGMKNRSARIKAQYQKSSWKLGLISLVCVIGNLAMVAAINIGEASRVLVIIEAMFIFVLWGEYIFLKEKTRVVRKSIAAISATVGAILMRIGT